MSRPDSMVGDHEVAPSLKKVNSAGSGRKRVSWREQTRDDGPKLPFPSPAGDLGSHEEEGMTSPLTDASHYSNSPVTSLFVESPSAGCFPVQSGPVSRTVEHVLKGNLKTQLNNGFQTSRYHGNKQFLPKDSLEKLIIAESVEEYCSVHLKDEDPAKIVRYVFGCGSPGAERDLARQVFATLVLIDRPELISGVVKENIRDRDLPLVQCEERGIEYQLARRSSDQVHAVRLDCFSRWRMSDRKAFHDIQFQVNTPRFETLGPRSLPSPDQYVAIKLDDRSVMPFTFYDGEKQIVAGSSKVVRVKIHDAHHDFNKAENDYFALKTLDAGSSQSKKHFRLEVKALMKIRAKKRPHLVDILTTFKYDNKYHLLFRWADGGNLADLWDDGINEVMSYKLVLWIAEQCHGLADGLDGIHNAKLSSREVDSTVQLPNEPPSPTTGRSLSLPGMRTDNKDCGRHGDIKPPNILWFKQDANPHGPGTLKISDFGLTSFHTALTTQVSPAEQNGCTWTYAPPEYDLQEDISRPFDIWSLGCVYLEFMTWALRGSKGVVEFREERSTERGSRPKMRLDNFFVLQMVDSGDQRVAVVKDSVLKWIETLQSLPQCSPYISEFLDYIKDKMLVVDKTRRDRSAFVKKRMGDFSRKCGEDEDYAFVSDVNALQDVPGSTAMTTSAVRRRSSLARGHQQPATSLTSRMKRKFCFLF